MNGPDWGRAVDLFHAALERGEPERDRFLRDACGDDATLYETVQSLVGADQTGDDELFDRVAAATAADLIAGGNPVVAPGVQIGRYVVVSHLGSGGMGDVYRATDPLLARDVALKLLAPRFQNDPGFRRRLEREARAASSLNHPNIVTIYEVGRFGPYEFVASELIEGETLRSIIARGPLPLRDLAVIGAQIAAGLGAAHAAGIVHRDVKPENVMIRRDGLAKVLDFGVAMSSIPAEASLVSTGTAAIRTGFLGGTACYMSPEQALGERVDHRSDLFALGVVLYEMATGVRPFDGPSDAALYDALLHAPAVPPSVIRPELPAAVDALMGRALEKDRELRYQSAGDLTSDLKRLQRPFPASSLGPQAARVVPSTAWWRPAAVAAAALAIGLAAALMLRPPAAGGLAARFTFGPPPHTIFTLTGTIVPSVTVSVSPDGRQVAFLANEPNARGHLWLRALDSLDAAPLEDTDGATFPFWSPDGKNIAFFADGVLKVKALAGGAARTITETATGRGGAWNRDGVILYGTAEGPIYRVPAAGGSSVAVTTLDAAEGEAWHRFPEFLPDGNHFLYLARAGETRTLCIGALDGRACKRLLETDVRASYADPGYLLLVQNNALLARPFDTRRLEFAGDPVEIVPSVATSTALDASFAVSPGGVLAFASRVAVRGQLTWFDRSGDAVGTTGAPAEYLAVRLSPNDRSVAAARSAPTEIAPDIWLLDVERGAASRFTFNKWLDISPVWSPDGAAVVFSSSRSGRFEIFRRAARGGAQETTLFKDDAASMYPDDWSRDGRYIVYSTDPPGHSWDLGLLDLQTSKAAPLVSTQYNEYHARISPDGQWLAFTSDETGQPEVHLRPFPGGDADVVVSNGGGSEPSWRRDGRELFYLARDGTIMSVDLGGTSTIIPTRPRALFRTRIAGQLLPNVTSYAATADGQRFLVPTAESDRPPAAISVMVDWTSALIR